MLFSEPFGTRAEAMAKEKQLKALKNKAALLAYISQREMPS